MVQSRPFRGKPIHLRAIHRKAPRDVFPDKNSVTCEFNGQRTRPASWKKLTRFVANRLVSFVCRGSSSHESFFLLADTAKHIQGTAFAGSLSDCLPDSATLPANIARRGAFYEKLKNSKRKHRQNQEFRAPLPRLAELFSASQSAAAVPTGRRSSGRKCRLPPGYSR